MSWPSGPIENAPGQPPVVRDAGRRVEDALGKMGEKLAARRRDRAAPRPDRDRSRRELDGDY